jgi:sugar-specific transcriptional regulator TrmB
MNEGEYLELVNQLKEKFDKNENEMKKQREIVEAMRKDIISIYGFYRVIDNLIQIEGDYEEITLLSSSFRSMLSELFDSLTENVVIKIENPLAL